MPEEASATVFHPSEPPPVPLRRPSSAAVSYHVGLDTMMGRRSRHRPEEVAIDGFLLLDTGEYELVDGARPARRLLEDEGPRHRRTGPHREPGSGSHDPPRIPQVGSVWLVDGDLELPTTASAGSEEDTHARRADVRTRTPSARGRGPRARAGRSRIERGRSGRAGLPAAGSRGLFARSGRHRTEGPRAFIETLHVRDMLPEFRTD